MSEISEASSRAQLLQDLAIGPEPIPTRTPIKTLLALSVLTLLGYWLVPYSSDSLLPPEVAAEQAKPAVALNTTEENAVEDVMPQRQFPIGPEPALNDGIKLEASGYVVARREATVSAKITGKVERVLVNEGDFVRQGQLLATLDSSLLQSLRALKASQLRERQAGLAELQVAQEEARQLLHRMSEMNRKELISVAQFDNASLALRKASAGISRAEQEIESARNELDIAELQLLETEIRAPFDGVVVSRSAQAGEIVSPMSAGGGFTRTGICSLVDMDSLELEVEVNEANIRLIRLGQRVVARLNAFPEWAIPAEVLTLIPTADRTKATIKLRIQLLENDARILPEMGVRVAFYE